MSFENQTLRTNVDTLLEVANVAAAHAATALSRLTDRIILITVPDLLLGPLPELLFSPAENGQELLGVEMRILGQVRGRILYLMPKGDAGVLANLLLGQASLDENPSDDLTASCLQETANILGGAYTGALARMTGHDVMLSVPRLRVGSLVDLLSTSSHGEPPENESAFCVTTSLSAREVHPRLAGRLVLVSDEVALAAILEAVRLTAAQE
jgi:chemotaxis protein CheC